MLSKLDKQVNLELSANFEDNSINAHHVFYRDCGLTDHEASFGWAPIMQIYRIDEYQTRHSISKNWNGWDRISWLF